MATLTGLLGNYPVPVKIGELDCIKYVVISLSAVKILLLCKYKPSYSVNYLGP